MNDNKSIKSSGNLFLNMMINPIFIIFYGLFFYDIAQLCEYGNLAKTLPIVFVCGIFFILWLIIFIILSVHKKKKADLQLTENTSSKRSVLKVLFGIYKVAAIILLVVITLFFSTKIIKSGSTGKLSVLINKLKYERKVELTHDNIYQDGINGVLDDIEKKVNLPNDLYISSSFDLKFNKEGTITSIDTFLYGKDKKGKTQSFLISYHKDNSDYLSIYLMGETNDTYAKSKSLTPMIDVCNRIFLRDAINGWIEADYDTFGILYYGVREWGYQTEGIVYVDPSSATLIPDEVSTKEPIINYTVSVYLPEMKADTLSQEWPYKTPYFPIRYIPVESLTAISESNKQGAALLEEEELLNPNSEINQREIGTAYTNSKENTLEFYLSDRIGYKLVIVNAALGTYYYSLEKTEDGENFTILNEDPFLGDGGGAYDMTFLTEKIGFLCLSRGGGTTGALYRTEDGGATFAKVELPEVTLSITEQSVGNPFDYPYAPYYEDDLLVLEVGQGADGDYNGGANGLFSSEDNGIIWKYNGQKK